MKKQLHVRIAEHLRAGLDLRVEQSGKPLTVIVERYLAEGLARDAGQLVEIQSLPEIRNAVRDETFKAMSQAYQQLSTDLAQASKRETERLAKLSANSWRDSGIAWRLTYGLVSHIAGNVKAREWYEDAKAKAGKAIAGGNEQ